MSIGLLPRAIPSKQHRSICLTLLKNALPESAEEVEDWLNAAGDDWARAVGPRWGTLCIGDVGVVASIAPLDVNVREGTRDTLDISIVFRLKVKKMTPEEIEQVKKMAQEQAAIDAARWRTWTTIDGKYKVEGKFVKFGGGTLTLEKKDGTTVDVKLEVLCDEDQDFVKQRKWRKLGKAN